MGRHRRSATGHPAAGRDTAGTDTAATDPYSPWDRRPGSYAYGGEGEHPEPYADDFDDGHTSPYGHHFEDDEHTHPYGFSPVFSPEEEDTGVWGAPPKRGRRGAHRYRSRGSTAARTGLLGVSAAIAMGAVAVATGLLPGSAPYSIGGDEGATRVRSDGLPSNLRTRGGTDGSTTPAPSTTSARPTHSAEKPTTPSTPPATTEAAAPQETHTSASPRPSATTTHPKPSPTRQPSSTAPSHTAAQQPSPPVGTGGSAESAERAVLALVNDERDKAGCEPLRENAALAGLAGDFSAQMAAEGFFDHTDPEGRSPWDRAARAGITNLGGENIARGQADAAAVMDAWMHSSGHRANILNCSYHTIGVGVHFGAGGPWWTQDFGF